MNVAAQRLVRTAVGAVAGVSIAALAVGAWQGDDTEGPPDAASTPTSSTVVATTTTSTTVASTSTTTTSTTTTSTTTTSTTTTVATIVDECGGKTLVIEVPADDAETVEELLDSDQIMCRKSPDDSGSTTTSSPSTVAVGPPGSIATSTTASSGATTTTSTSLSTVPVIDQPVYFGAYTSQAAACGDLETLIASGIDAVVKQWSGPTVRAIGCIADSPPSTPMGDSDQTITTSSVESPLDPTAPED